mmetsp:Transcript_51096/g.123337  ORF Transcript_51096/g.123337 Transcript_51096/m.123337 type:complete len:975 (-) Transcript_51096:1262-4186(-)
MKNQKSSIVIPRRRIATTTTATTTMRTKTIGSPSSSTTMSTMTTRLLLLVILIVILAIDSIIWAKEDVQSQGLGGVGTRATVMNRMVVVVAFSPSTIQRHRQYPQYPLSTSTAASTAAAATTTTTITSAATTRALWLTSSLQFPSSCKMEKMTTTMMLARRNKNRRSGTDDEDDLNRWYDEVDKDATPDEVFWEEMERQRLLFNNDESSTSTSSSDPTNLGGDDDEIYGSSASGSSSSSSSSLPPPLFPTTTRPTSSTSTSPVATVSSSSSTGSSSINNPNGGSGPFAPPPMSGLTGVMSANGSGGVGPSSSSPSPSSSAGASSSSSSASDDGNRFYTPMRRRSVPSMTEIKVADATLSEYELFMVSDNWLDEELQQLMNVDNDNSVVEEEEEDGDDEADTMDHGFELSEEHEENVDDQKTEDELNAIAKSRFLLDDEPWDLYFDEEKEEDIDSNDLETTQRRRRTDPDRRLTVEVPFPAKDSEFYYDPAKYIPSADPHSSSLSSSAEEEIELEKHELKFREQMKNCRISSSRLEKARRSEKAKQFFSRDPNEKEGFEHLWVAAVDNVSFKPLVGNFRDYGVEFADNFGDFQDNSAYDGLYQVDEMARLKARMVHEVTGLPVVASRTGFEIEPVPPPTKSLKEMTASGNRAAVATRMSNPKVSSGYRINDIANHVDYLTEALRPLSEPTRVTRFTTCLCFYDGKMEILEYGVCDVDMHFSNSIRTYIPIAQAMSHMMETLKMTFGLEYQKFLRTRRDNAQLAGLAASSLPYSPGRASMRLRDRVLKDGRVLPNDIIDVSKFMDSQVDVNLMDECAQELAERFMEQKPTKIVTVATTGLVIALPMAKYLQVPVVYARKERNVVMADTYSASYSSKTVGKNRQLLISKSHIHEDDRILVVDDFLSSGASQEALLRIISDAGAKAVGVGVLLEKMYESGRQSLSGFNVPIQSLCRVASVKDGIISLVEEEGYSEEEY